MTFATADLANALYGLSVDVDDQGPGGGACTSYNKTVNCPTGGTVMISGSCQGGVTNGTGPQHISYSMAMMGCSDVSNGISVTLTGTADLTGSQSFQNGAAVSSDQNFQAQTDVMIEATETGYTSFSQSCTFGITYSMGSSKTLSGSLCGQSFSKTF
jgi:hypothetical protein